MEIGVMAGIVITFIAFILLEVKEFKQLNANSFKTFLGLNFIYLFVSLWFGVVGGAITQIIKECFRNKMFLIIVGSILWFVALKMILYGFYVNKKSEYESLKQKELEDEEKEMEKIIEKDRIRIDKMFENTEQNIKKQAIKSKQNKSINKKEG